MCEAIPGTTFVFVPLLDLSPRNRLSVLEPEAKEPKENKTRVQPGLSIGDIAPDSWVPAQRQQRAHEDSYQTAQIGPFRYFAVFDGHGRPNQLGVRHVGHYAMKNLHLRLAEMLAEIDVNDEEEVKEIIRTTFIALDCEMHARDLEAGSTCTMVLIHDARKLLYQVNLGDSRSIMFNGDQILAATVDHSVTDSEERTRIEAAGGYVSMGRLQGAILVSRAFGDFEFKMNKGAFDVVNGMMSVVPDVTVRKFTGGHVLLTSDAPFEVHNNEKLIGKVIIQLRANPPDTKKALINVVEDIIKTTTDDTTLVLVNL
jgi:serine/threonine protein phosphatase PrpC